MTVCDVCGLPARVVDLDADVAYCDEHANERLVCARNHEHLPEVAPL